VSHAGTKHATRIGLHDPTSERLDERFTPHCCRHWFTTHLRRNGMQRELIKELRGYARRDAMDIYDHIDKRELKRAYLAAIPQLGI
jgi:integrase/recombinase XerD